MPVNQDLALHLDALKKNDAGMVRVDQIGDVVASLLRSLSGDVAAADLRLYREVEGLATYIRTAKAEIAELRPQDIRTEYISVATDELDAIVDATESATNTILDAAERLEEAGAAAPAEIGQTIVDATTKIYEACNFQDITGQRITKVVKALQHIESKVEAIIAAFGPVMGDKPSGNPVKSPAARDPNPEDSLLNGPQLPETASDQAAVDALFKS